MALTFTPATKQALKARIAIEGPSGSGKTYTALVTAQALGKRIALVDTEKRSASLYADLFQFDTLQLDRFAPEILIEALAAASGHDVCIVDSFSHFWMGTDGMLEQVDRAAKRSGGGNTFAGWKDMRPIERRMIDAILAYPGHLIATLRTKSEWVVEENERGKKVPKKIGLKAEQREGLEYEFTLVGTMDLENTLVVTKSRCPELSSAVITRPTAEFGATLLRWLDAGAAAASAVELRDEILASPHLTVDELRGYHARAKAAGQLGTAMLDEHGDTTTFGEWIVERGKAAAPQPSPAPQPATPDVDFDDAVDLDEGGPAMVTERQHRRMHALWNHLGYQGEENREQRLTIIGKIIGRDLATSKDLTEAEADGVIEALDAEKTSRARKATAPADEPMTAEQRTRLFAALKAAGLVDKDAILAQINEAIAPATVGSSKELSEFQAAQAIAAIEALVPA